VREAWKRTRADEVLPKCHNKDDNSVTAKISRDEDTWIKTKGRALETTSSWYALWLRQNEQLYTLRGSGGRRGGRRGEEGRGAVGGQLALAWQAQKNRAKGHSRGKKANVWVRKLESCCATGDGIRRARHASDCFGLRLWVTGSKRRNHKRTKDRAKAFSPRHVSNKMRIAPVKPGRDVTCYR
jgi:hypothetical protein